MYICLNDRFAHEDFNYSNASCAKIEEQEEEEEDESLMLRSDIRCGLNDVVPPRHFASRKISLKRLTTRGEQFNELS